MLTIVVLFREKMIIEYVINYLFPRICYSLGSSQSIVTWFIQAIAAVHSMISYIPRFYPDSTKAMQSVFQDPHCFFASRAALRRARRRISMCIFLLYQIVTGLLTPNTFSTTHSMKAWLHQGV